jgi:hypothetical protein
VGYLIAAYVVVVGSLVAYGLWIQHQRRALARRGGAGAAEDAATGDARGAR